MTTFGVSVPTSTPPSIVLMSCAGDITSSTVIFGCESLAAGARSVGSSVEVVRDGGGGGGNRSSVDVRPMTGSLARGVTVGIVTVPNDGVRVGIAGGFLAIFVMIRRPP